MEKALAILKITPKIKQVPQEEKQSVSYHVEPYKPPIPFPRRLKHHAEEALVHETMESLKKIKINYPLLKEIRQINNYAKHIKNLVANKPKTEDDEEIRMNPSFIEGHTAKGVRLRVADSHTGNHHRDDFKSLETIRRFLWCQEEMKRGKAKVFGRMFAFRSNKVFLALGGLDIRSPGGWMWPVAAMPDFKSFSKLAHAWLSKIPPIHWVMSHFSGRAHYYVLLNNMCDAFNGKIVGGRHKLIITTLEYIGEYYMKRIVIVVNVIEKSVGSLTPTATHMLDLIQK
ncbi:hypothetical protein Tco_0196104 [Tanacetum coccineum]